MAEYDLVVTSTALRAIGKLPEEIQQLINQSIDGLKYDPRPAGCFKMTDYETIYRLRIRRYRVLYNIYDKRLVVQVIDADHRRDAYR